MNIWIKNARILTMDDDRLIVENSNLYVKGNEIYHIGDIIEDFECERVLDGKGKLIMPGFINAHTHIAMSIFRNYGNDVSLDTWLNDYIWPLEAKLTAEDVRIGSELSMAEMIESGTTCFVDMYYFMDEVAKAARDTGMRAVLTRGMTNPTKDILDNEIRFFKEWHGSSNDRIEVMVGSHAVYTNDKEALENERDLAKELGVGINIHLNETSKEVEDCLSQNGLRPIEYVDSLGLLNEKTIGAHCIWLDHKERAIAKDRGISMVHNPSSNMKLASGFMKAQELLDEGINVCLGTDGQSSNNVLDMFDEMRVASLIAKGSNLDPENLRALTVLKMATVNGAKAIGKEGRLGKVKEGYLADIIMVDFDNLRHVPNNDIAASLVYSTNGFDVDTTIVDGNILYENKKHLTVNPDQLKNKINGIFERLIGE